MAEPSGIVSQPEPSGIAPDCDTAKVDTAPAETAPTETAPADTVPAASSAKQAPGPVGRVFEKQAKLTAHCPCACMTIGYVIAFFLVILGAMSSMEPNLPGDGRNVYAVVGWEGTDKHDSMLHAMDSMAIEGVADQQSIPSKEYVLINYVAGDGNAFSLANLERMQTLELRVMAFPGYADKCLRERGVCSVMSIVTHLTDDGTVGGALPSDQAGVDRRLGELSEAGSAGFHFDSRFTAVEPRSAMTRAYFFMGLPLAGYRDQNDRAFDQETAQSDWELEISAMLDEHMDDYNSAGLEYFYLGGNALLQKHVNERLFADVLFALCSFVFVWSYMWYHTDSVFLASFGMLMVVFAFPAARGVSMHLFGVLWFDFLNQLLIFLLMGIGADNLFVTLDAFKQSNYAQGVVTESMTEEEKLAARLGYMLNRACHAMATTSGTTAAAFLTQIFSGITPTAGFGIYAGCMIIINFLFCATIFPAAIAVHHTYIKKRCACCRCPITLCVEKRRGKNTEDDATLSTVWSVERYSGQERFFYGRVAPFIVGYRIPIFCFSFVLAVSGIVLMSQITTASESPTFMPEDDILQTTFNRLQCSSSADHCYVDGQAAEISNVVVMVWGIQRAPDRQDHSRFQDFTSECENSVCGQHIWDDSFDLRNGDVQQRIAAVCDDGLALANVGGIGHCVMRDFRTWLAEAPLSRGGFPVPEADFNARFSEFISHEEVLEDGNSTRPFRSQYLDTRFVGIEPDGRVRYIIVGWNTQFILGKLYPSSQIEGVYNEFMDFERETASRFRAVDAGGDPFVCESKGHELFLIMRMSQEFEAGVWRGLQISLTVAFFMLLISTGNIVIALIAIFTIFCVTACTIGSMVLYGWEIGIIESICAVLVVGFAVDYTVHYGISYVERRPEDNGKYALGNARGDRVTHAFFELGTSVLGGAATTLGASLFLFMCKVQFFKIFGVFMCTVIVWSFVFASILFMPLCALVGPQGVTGDLSREAFRQLFRSGKTQ